MKKETQHAIDLHRAGKTVYMAAKLAGVAQSTVSRALARQATACPTCGALPRVHPSQATAAPDTDQTADD